MTKIFVIGAGISALVVANHLQKEGCEVEIFERDSNLGGCLSSWSRNDCNFNSRILSVPTLKNPFGDYLKSLGAFDKLKKAKPTELQFVYQDQKFIIPRSFRKFKKLLNSIASSYPQDQELLHNYLEHIETYRIISKHYYGKIQTQPIIPKINPKKNIGYFSDQFSNPILSFLLAGPWVKFFDASSVYLFYASYIESLTAANINCNTILENLANSFLKSGGIIHKSSEITQYLVEQNKITGIIHKSEARNCDFLIHSGDILKIINDNLIPKTVFNPEILERLSQTKACSFIQVVHFLDLSNCKGIKNRYLKYKLQNPIILNHKTIDELLIEISLDSNENKCQLLTFIYQDSEDSIFWNQLSPEEYKSTKKHLLASIEKEIFAFFPELTNRILASDIATPKTFEKYTNSLYGQFTGNYDPFRTLYELDNLTNYRNLYFVGFRLFSGGFYEAALSAKIVAEHILKNLE